MQVKACKDLLPHSNVFACIRVLNLEDDEMAEYRGCVDENDQPYQDKCKVVHTKEGEKLAMCNFSAKISGRARKLCKRPR
ncbi:hypothetical protein TcasGA2_TC006615 [Tribolium castaneum]|uniref:Uncharacterized protein n=1 Tax=Tribolium castaneum TaxID=7070 RepID=D6WXV4_TRICA|nr:hypothetical protein TcasGA2_TC006615 [Tribolium castaneum]